MEVRNLSPWDGIATPPGGDVLCPDLFADVLHMWDRPGGRPGNGYAPRRHESIAQTLATVAAHHEQESWLATEHVARCAAFLDWVTRQPLSATPSALMSAFNTLAWPLPNLTLLAPPSQLDALLRLPAARYGVVISSAEEAEEAIELIREWLCCGSCGRSYSLDEAVPDPEGHPSGADTCAKCGDSGCMISVWGDDQLDSWTEGRRDPAIEDGLRVSALLLRGEWARCGGCGGRGSRSTGWPNFVVEPCFGCMPPMSRRGTGLSPDARNLACQSAGVEVRQCRLAHAQPEDAEVRDER